MRGPAPVVVVDARRLATWGVAAAVSAVIWFALVAAAVAVMS